MTTIDSRYLPRAIKAAQHLGFTLDEARELLNIGSHRDSRPRLREHSRPRLREHSRHRIAEIDAQIAALQPMRGTLVEAIHVGCADLLECTCDPNCPVSFPDLGRDRLILEHASMTPDPASRVAA